MSKWTKFTDANVRVYYYDNPRKQQKKKNICSEFLLLAAHKISKY